MSTFPGLLVDTVWPCRYFQVKRPRLQILRPVLFHLCCMALLSPAMPEITTAAPQMQAGTASAHSPAAISFSFHVNKTRPTIPDTLIYALLIWNDPLQADTLHGVEAEFTLPRLANGSFALKPASFAYGGTLPFVFDPLEGLVRWQAGNLVRHVPPLPSDTVRISFAFALAEVADFSLTCGDNPLTATARVSFVDARGQRIYPGTPRAAESTLTLTPDFVAERVAPRTSTVGRGDTLVVDYFFRNQGNSGRAATFCLRVPRGIEAGQAMISPDSLRLTVIQADSFCVDLGFVPAGGLFRFTLLLPVAQDLDASSDTFCLNGRLLSDCDLLPGNNFFASVCLQVRPLDLLSVTKRVHPLQAQVGDTLSYTITLANLAPFVTAWNLTLSDVLPVGAELLAASGSYAYADGVLTWQWPSLAPGARDSVHLTVHIPLGIYSGALSGNACTGAQLLNVADLTSTARDGSASPEAPQALGNNRALIAVSLSPLGDLLEVQLSTRAVPPANLSRLVPGDTLIHTLSCFNRSDRAMVREITLVDSLPDPALARLLDSPPPGFVLDADGNRLMRSNLELAPRTGEVVEFRTILRTEAQVCETVSLFHRAAILASNPVDCQMSNNRATSAVDFVAWSNLISLEVQGGSAVAPGGELELLLQYRSENGFTPAELSVFNRLAPEWEIVTISGGGRLVAPGLVQWQVAPPAAGQSGTVALRLRLPEVARCEAARVENLAWVQSSPRDCQTEDDSSRQQITLLATPEQLQPRLEAQFVLLQDENRDGCAEPGERVVARLAFVNLSGRPLPAVQISFLEMRALVGSAAWPIRLLEVNPPVLAPGDTGYAHFEFVIGANDFTAAAISIAGTIAAEGTCPRTIDDLPGEAVRFCAQPEVFLTRVDLHDRNGDRDGLAAEGETLDAVVVYENPGPLPADSLILTVHLTPAGFNLVQSNKPAGATMPLIIRERLAAGAADSLTMQLSYADFGADEEAVRLTASLQTSSWAGPQPSRQDAMAIRHDCHARPNPFIPARHPAGVRFAPNDGQRVEIYDLEGNRVRTLESTQFWDGRDVQGHALPPGVYVWTIAGACRGTLVLVR